MEGGSGFHGGDGGEGFHGGDGGNIKIKYTYKWTIMELL